MRRMLALWVLPIAVMACLATGLAPAGAATQAHEPTALPNTSLSPGLWDAFGNQSFGTFPAHNNGHNNPITIGGAPMVVNLDHNCESIFVLGQWVTACEIEYGTTGECFNWYSTGDWVSLDSCVAGDTNELMIFDSGGSTGEYYIENVAADRVNGASDRQYLAAENNVFQCDGTDASQNLYEQGWVPNCAGNQWLWVS